MKSGTLLTVTAAIEAPTGLLLLMWPSAMSSILLGVPLEAANGLVVARMAGAALLSLSAVCWLVRDDENAPKVTAVVLFYNLVAVAVLAYAGVARGLAGIILWPVVALHLVLALWCAYVALGSARWQLFARR